MANIGSYVILIILILILDVIWLTINKQRYNYLVRSVQGSDINVNMGYAFLTYILVIASILFIAIPLVSFQMSKRRGKGLLWNSLVYGGGVGLCIYGIFNFTNMSIFKGYKLSVAIMDTIWGTILYTVACYRFLSIN